MTSEYLKNLEMAKNALRGQPIEEARKAAEAAGWTLRVMRDGEIRYLGDCAYRPNRIDVAVDDGIITGFAGDPKK